MKSFSLNFPSTDKYNPNLAVNAEVLKRLSATIQQMKGDMSQRDFAKILGVSQSAVQAWESGKNPPNFEHLEKLAAWRGELPEEFVAHLYGRTRENIAPNSQPVKASEDVLDTVKKLTDAEKFKLALSVATKLPENLKKTLIIELINSL